MLIVCDFDGTVTERDTLNHLCATVAPEPYAELARGLASGQINLHQEIARALALVTQEESEAVQIAVRGTRIRPGFAEFVEQTRLHGHRLVLVSAGMAQLIEPLLHSAGVHDVELRANQVSFGPAGAQVVFRNRETCQVCGEPCKRSDLETLRTDGEPVVYIGDGYSDRCAALAADRTFARAGLAQYLRDRRHPFEPFEDFFQIADALRL